MAGTRSAADFYRWLGRTEADLPSSQEVLRVAARTPALTGANCRL